GECLLLGFVFEMRKRKGSLPDRQKGPEGEPATPTKAVDRAFVGEGNGLPRAFAKYGFQIGLWLGIMVLLFDVLFHLLQAQIRIPMTSNIQQSLWVLPGFAFCCGVAIALLLIVGAFGIVSWGPVKNALTEQLPGISGVVAELQRRAWMRNGVGAS